ncbi:MAG: hypothetical protein ACJAT7_000651 [Psychromonas sp.]|jgi:hypothetical protein|uniref:hypothetical protein n=1 Tax=Psychromonas sp. TaxID=1884585 RepID=UPI0039E53BAF
MKGRSLIAAVLIVIAALCSFVIWQVGNSTRYNVDDLGFFKQQQGQLVIQYGQQLFWIAPDERLVKQLDLNSLQLSAAGDYDFFSNGDLLIYHRNKPLSLLENLQQYLRLTKKTQINQFHKMGDDGFYRCQLSMQTCQPFGINLPLLSRSFRVTIDSSDDSLYLADTSAHKLYKISSVGEILSVKGDGKYKFPNQISLLNGQLWIADTNHHRLVAVQATTADFADQTASFITEPGIENRWPHQFTYAENSLWVNIADHTMSAGLIQQYSLTGKPLTQAILQCSQDPTALIVWQNKLWVADFISARIEQLNLQGESLGLFQLPQLDKLLAARDQQIAEGTVLSHYGLLGFALTFILGLVAAWLLEKEESVAIFTNSIKDPTDKLIASAQQTGKEKYRGNEVFWLTNNVVKHKRKLYLLGSLFLVPILLLLVLFQTSPIFIELILGSMIVYIMVAAMYVYLFTYFLTLKLGVQGDRLYLQVRGERQEADFSAVHYSSGYLISEKLALPFGNIRQRLFNKKQLNDYLFSQLKTENKLKPSALFIRLWQLKERLFLANSYFLLIIVILAILAESFF